MSTDIRDAFFSGVYDAISQDKNVIILTADHSSFVLSNIQKEYPKQYYNVGVSEQNMASAAAGLALCNKIVYIYSIVGFTSFRCMEQINIDISGMNLHVNIISVGAGFTYSTDGPSHHGIQDLAAVSSMPNLHIFNTTDATHTYKMALMGYQKSGPKYFRISKGQVPDIYNSTHGFEDGISCLRHGSDIAIISSGLMIHRSIEVANELEKSGYSVMVIDVYRIKPINEEMLLQMIGNVPRVVTIEDNISVGGLGQTIGYILSRNSVNTKFNSVSVGNQYCFQYHCDKTWMENYYGLGTSNIVEKIHKWHEI